jgi:hypothetical protein
VRRKGARRVRREAARKRPDCRDLAARPTLFDVPRELAQFVAKLLLAERRRRGTPRGSRALTCFWQAVLGLRWFRDRTTPDALARDHGISRATAYRYLDEVIAVLAGQASELHQALERAQDAGFGDIARAALVLTHFEHGYIT